MTNHEAIYEARSLPPAPRIRSGSLPTWATPGWNGDWGGEAAQILNSLETVNGLLREAGHEPRFIQVSLSWEHGRKEETSVEEARKALQFAQPPERVGTISSFGRHADEWISIEGRRYEDGKHTVRVSTNVRDDFELARRLVEAVKHEIEPPPVEPSPVAQAGPAPEPLRVRASTRGHLAHERMGIGGWLESHVGLLTAIGVTATVIGVVVAVVIAV